MEAYSKALLLKELEKQGITSIAEDILVATVKGVFGYLTQSAILSDTPYDNMAVPLYPLVQDVAIKKLDSVDGEDDGR